MRVAALLLAMAGRALAAADWLEGLHLTATGSASWVDNLSRTSAVANRQDAQTYEFSLGSTQLRQLAPNILLVAGSEVSSLTVPDFRLTDHLKAGGRLALQTKFGLGPQAVVLQVSGAATYKSARLQADRGWGGEFSVQLAKRLWPDLRIAAQASWLEHNARRAAFDLNQHAYRLEAQWDIDERWSLSGSAGRLSGDIVANAAWPVWVMALAGDFGPAVQHYYSARPWMVTNLYGAGWTSYNVEAEVDLWSLALGCRLGDRTSLELRRAGAFVVNKLGITYPTSSWSLGLHHRF